MPGAVQVDVFREVVPHTEASPLLRVLLIDEGSVQRFPALARQLEQTVDLGAAPQLRRREQLRFDRQQQVAVGRELLRELVEVFDDCVSRFS